MAQPTPPKKTNASITLPSVDQPISRQDAIPDAPPSDRPAPAEVSPEDSANFLNSVREANEERSDKSAHKELVTKGKDEVPRTKPETPKNEGTEETEREDKKPDPSDAFPNPDTEDEPEEIPKPRKTKEDSVADLKRNLQTERTRATKLESELAEYRTKVESYTGVDERLQEVEKLQARIKQLEPLEKIFSMHAMPEFQEKYVKGVQAKVTVAKEIADSYSVRPEVIDHALKITDRRQLNSFLGQQFKNDALAVSDVREQILGAQALLAEREKLEKSPEESKDILSEMVSQNQTKERETALSTVKKKQQDGWSDILNYYGRGDAAVHELTEVPGDPDHNERRDRVLNLAATEYGKVVGMLAHLGLKDLPKPLAHSLASYFQLGQLAPELLERLRAVETEKTQLQKKLDKLNGYKRPSYETGGTVREEKKEPETTAQRSESVFMGARQKVLDQQTSS